MQEIEFIQTILDEHGDKPTCQHFRKESVKCGLNDQSLGAHEIQLWCLDKERCHHCMFYKNQEITFDQLNEITLDVADLLKRKHKIETIHNPSLDFLKSNISRYLDFNGYRVPELGYVDWVNLKLERKQMSLQGKAKRLKKLLNDKNIQTIGIAEKGEFNPEEYLSIYLFQDKQGYPTEFEGTKVQVHCIGEIKIERSADGGI